MVVNGVVPVRCVRMDAVMGDAVVVRTAVLVHRRPLLMLNNLFEARRQLSR